MPLAPACPASGATRWNSVQQIEPGDFLLAYLTGVSRFVGVLKVMSPAFRTSTPITTAPLARSFASVVRRLALVLAVAVGGLMLEASPAVALKCGVWRWPVKTLSDKAARRVHYSPRYTTVRNLRSLGPPSTLTETTPRLQPIEYEMFRLKAKLVGAVLEDDHDYHVVIRSPTARNKTMIVEFPYTRCNGARRSAKKAVMKRARHQFETACGSVGTSWVDLRGRVTVTGVGFWDEVHGQTGVAPNGIELHPVLRFNGSCRRS